MLARLKRREEMKKVVFAKWRPCRTAKLAGWFGIGWIPESRDELAIRERDGTLCI
jgi:hypothetical protein